MKTNIFHRAIYLKSWLHGYKRGFPRPEFVTFAYNLKVTLFTKTKRVGCNHVTTEKGRYPIEKIPEKLKRS